jgi:hypothetical protein
MAVSYLVRVDLCGKRDTATCEKCDKRDCEYRRHVAMIATGDQEFATVLKVMLSGLYRVEVTRSFEDGQKP